MDADRLRVRSGSPFEEAIGFSRAVRTGERIVVSGTAPIWPDGSCPEDAGAQARRCFEIALTAVEQLGGSAAGVVRTRMFITDASVAMEVGAAHRKAVGAAAPASTMVVVAALLDPRWKVEIELEAVAG
ncbi:MAG TPA: RidA family protein [Candidatus Dormibacteraeota bacterium]|nr:RidA family protein [Candidatus Dormibacteraeota bacterium]